MEWEGLHNQSQCMYCLLNWNYIIVERILDVSSTFIKGFLRTYREHGNSTSERHQRRTFDLEMRSIMNEPNLCSGVRILSMIFQFLLTKCSSKSFSLSLTKSYKKILSDQFPSLPLLKGCILWFIETILSQKKQTLKLHNGANYHKSFSQPLFYS